MKSHVDTIYLFMELKKIILNISMQNYTNIKTYI